MHIYNQDYILRYFGDFLKRKYDKNFTLQKDGYSSLIIKNETDFKRRYTSITISSINSFCGGVLVNNLDYLTTQIVADIYFSIVDDFCTYNGYSNAFLILSKDIDLKLLQKTCEKFGWEKQFTMENIRTKNECYFYHKKYSIDSTSYESNTLLRAIREE